MTRPAPATKTQRISLTNGAVRYTFPITVQEQTGRNITADPVYLSLGDATTPGTWRVPELVITSNAIDPDSGLTLYSVTMRLLVGVALRPATGSYWVHYKIGDNPEIVVERSALQLQIL